MPIVASDFVSDAALELKRCNRLLKTNPYPVKTNRMEMLISSSYPEGLLKKLTSSALD